MRTIEELEAAMNGTFPRSRDATVCNRARASDPRDAQAETQAEPEVESPNASQLSVQQLQAVELLALGLTLREVADRLRVHRTTIFRWRQTYPAFGKELRRRTRVETAELASRMRGLLMKATQYAEIALETDGSKDVWSERILRNRRIWALATSPAADEDESIDAPSDAARRDAQF